VDDDDDDETQDDDGKAKTIYRELLKQLCNKYLLCSSSGNTSFRFVCPQIDCNKDYRNWDFTGIPQPLQVSIECLKVDRDRFFPHHLFVFCHQ
jgi:hypothetical protein